MPAQPALIYIANVRNGPGFGIAGVFVLAATSAEAHSDRRVVAVFGLENNGTQLQQLVVDRMSDYIASQLVGSGRYKAVPNDDLKRALELSDRGPAERAASKGLPGQVQRDQGVILA